MAQFTLDGVTYSKFRDIPGAVYTRSGVEYQQNAAGVWTPFDENVPPISSGVGVDVWEARTNSIRNPTGLGAVVGVVGSGGALPTNWASAAHTGLTREVVGVGTENGLPYIDFKLSGTNTSGAQQQLSVDLEALTQVSAAQGQIWTLPVWLALKAGAFPSGTAELWVAERNSGGGLLVPNGLNLKPLVSGTLTRIVQSVTLGNGSTAYASPTLRFIVPDGETYSFALRIAAPNLKLGADINDPPILQTNNAAATRGNPSMYINAPGLLVPPYTVVAWANLSAIDGVGRVLVAASDGTNTNRVQLERNSGNSAIMQVNGGTGGSGPAVTGKGGARLLKMAARVSATEYALSVDGAAPAKATGITPPPGLSQIRFGATPAGAGFLNSPLQRFQIINRDVTDAELRALAA